MGVNNEGWNGVGVAVESGADVISMNGSGACSGTSAEADAPHAVSRQARNTVKRVRRYAFMNRC